MTTAFQRSAFQNNAFQIDDIRPGQSIPGTGGWGAGLGSPLSRRREYVEAENRRLREIEAFEREFEKAWEEVFPPPPVEIQTEPSIQWPVLTEADLAAARQRVLQSERARAAVEAMLSSLNQAIAEREREVREEDDAEALLLLLST